MAPAPYNIEEHRAVRRFLKRHQDLADEIEDIRNQLSLRPYVGPRIDHLKARYQCSRRWRAGDYRLLYEILEAESIVHIFHADVRGDVY